MRGAIPVRDHMENLFDQNKIHNQGARMEQELKTKEDTADKANLEGDHHDSTQELALPVPQDRFSEMDFAKLAKS